MNQNDFMLALTLYAKSIPFHVLIMAAILTANEQEEKESGSVSQRFGRKFKRAQIWAVNDPCATLSKSISPFFVIKPLQFVRTTAIISSRN